MASGENGKAVFLLASEGLTKNETLKSAGLTGIRLPVAPLDVLNIDQEININNQVLPLSGSVAFGGGPGLLKVSFDSLLPMENTPRWAHMPNGQYPWRDVNWYTKLLRDLSMANDVFRLVVSEPAGGAGGYLEGGIGDNRLAVDTKAMISSFSITDEEGDCLWYTIEFTEYKVLTYSTVRRDIGPEFYTVDVYKTLEQIANGYRMFDVRWQNLLRLNKNLKQPVKKKGQKPKKVTNQKQVIKKGTKLRLRTKTGAIDAIDDFDIGKENDVDGVDAA